MVLVDNTLVSVSSDSTIRLWNPFSIDELDEATSSCIRCLNENKGNDELKILVLIAKKKISSPSDLNIFL